LFAGWSSPVARQAHNLKVVGSNPAPATNFQSLTETWGFFAAVEKPYQVYVIQNPVGRFYIGLTEDVSFRLQQHNDGISTWTRIRGPWKLVWTSPHLPLGAARKLENLLKRQKGGSGFYKMTGLTDLLPPSGSYSRVRDRWFKSSPRNQFSTPHGNVRLFLS
jgi:predicted GIY-YIG superfamily endonuclease